ncbi:Two-component regulatory system, response regulator protein [Burkholderia cenocepacia]|uniref:winged helix-turn-helix transcriptional regulator n=1 Tax=Burkholderia cenocepacia TaxID=95486 RepID=UPI001A62DAD7|nr:winged helix-turn-helix domain-containing protein [Burkholderia cenocepacia]CAD9223055.1 Two-component regulatory system, response regulator protein [Burkholderia cenocepacia]
MTDAPSTAVAILTIDHPSRGTFDDRLRRAGYGYDRLRIDDILRRAGYRPSRFEYLPDLLASCDTRAFDLFVVQCETACRRTTDAIQALRARFAGTVAIVSISQRDAELARSVCFVAGANEHHPYTVAPDTLIASIATWLRWSHHRATHHRHWRIGAFEFDTATRSVNVAGREHVLTEKHFQIATAFFLNMGRALDRAHVSQLVWGSLVAASSRRLDTHVAYLRDRLELDGRHGVKMMTMYGFGYRLVTCEPGAEPAEEDAARQ